MTYEQSFSYTSTSTILRVLQQLFEHSPKINEHSSAYTRTFGDLMSTLTYNTFFLYELSSG